MRTELTPGAREGRELARRRRRRLESAGFSPPLAGRLARDSRSDVHALVELVERGCSPELAARILVPLEEGEAA
jgi:hypothetical protein